MLKRTQYLVQELLEQTWLASFLTDSTSFREYIGTFDEGPEYYYYQVLGDTVYIEKYKSSDGKTAKELLEKEILIISDLKKTNTIK